MKVILNTPSDYLHAVRRKDMVRLEFEHLYSDTHVAPIERRFEMMEDYVLLESVILVFERENQLI